MGVSGNNVLSTIIFMIGFAASQEYYEELHKAKYTTHLREIPKRFEIRGDHATEQFAKRFRDIQDIAKSENITILYKVKVEVIKPFLHQNTKNIKERLRKGKSKKYNVPLKKNSMKLSNFEIFLRKMADETGHNAQKFENNMYTALTTEKQKMIPAKQIQLKYKPIISKIKTNYTKIVKPVKNREIVLTA